MGRPSYGVKAPAGWEVSTLTFYRPLPSSDPEARPELWVRRSANPETGLIEWKAELELVTGRTHAEFHGQDLASAFAGALELAERHGIEVDG